MLVPVSFLFCCCCVGTSLFVYLFVCLSRICNCFRKSRYDIHVHLKLTPLLILSGFVLPIVLGVLKTYKVPPMSELQVMWWLCRMEGKVNMLPIPNDHHYEKVQPRSYMVLGGKYPYGVDYGNYMHRVAEDFNAAPTLSTLAFHKENRIDAMKALFVYCLGQSHIPLFRLQGPFASSKCWNIVETELWEVCINRGWFENFGLIIVCWISLWMNIGACIIEICWCFLTMRRPKFFVRY